MERRMQEQRNFEAEALSRKIARITKGEESYTGAGDMTIEERNRDGMVMNLDRPIRQEYIAEYGPTWVSEWKYINDRPQFELGLADQFRRKGDFVQTLNNEFMANPEAQKDPKRIRQFFDQTYEQHEYRREEKRLQEPMRQTRAFNNNLFDESAEDESPVVSDEDE